MVHSRDGDTNFFNIVAGVLQDTLAPFLFIIGPSYILQSSIDLMKENRFTLTTARNRRYLTEAITDADYADNLGLLVNTPA